TCMSAYCGTCAACHRGETWLCARRDQPPVMRGEGPARITLDDTDVAQGLGIGGLSEMVLVHEHALAPVPDDLPAHFASLLGCGVLTGFGAVVNAARLEPGESLVVIGCGGVGLAAVN